MGCDIHCYLQVRNRRTDNWEVVEEVELGRYYPLFDVINNVRGDRYFPMAISYTPDITITTDNTSLPFVSVFGLDAIKRAELPYEDEAHIYLGEHSFCVLTIGQMLMYNHYKDIQDNEIIELLGRLLFKMLSKKAGDGRIRYIIGFDS